MCRKKERSENHPTPEQITFWYVQHPNVIYRRNVFDFFGKVRVPSARSHALIGHVVRGTSAVNARKHGQRERAVLWQDRIVDRTVAKSSMVKVYGEAAKTVGEGLTVTFLLWC